MGLPRQASLSSLPARPLVHLGHRRRADDVEMSESGGLRGHAVRRRAELPMETSRASSAWLRAHVEPARYRTPPSTLPDHAFDFFHGCQWHPDQLRNHQQEKLIFDFYFLLFAWQELGTKILAGATSTITRTSARREQARRLRCGPASLGGRRASTTSSPATTSFLLLTVVVFIGLNLGPKIGPLRPR